MCDQVPVASMPINVHAAAAAASSSSAVKSIREFEFEGTQSPFDQNESREYHSGQEIESFRLVQVRSWPYLSVENCCSSVSLRGVSRAEVPARESWHVEVHKVSPHMHDVCSTV